MHGSDSGIVQGGGIKVGVAEVGGDCNCYNM